MAADNKNTFDRVPPHDLDAEQSVLGAMLLSVDAIGEVFEIVRSSDFYALKHEKIFDAITTLYTRGDGVDVVTLVGELQKTNELKNVGDAPYLYELVEKVPTAANATYYAKIVKNCSILRSLITAGTEITKLGYSQYTDTPIDLVNVAQSTVYEIAERDLHDEYSSIHEISKNALEEIEKGDKDPNQNGVMTGFHDIDKLIGGFKPGQMIVVAARPGVGKSTLSLDFARNAALRYDKSVALFSLEMSKSEIAMRFLSSEANVPLKNLKNPRRLTDEQKLGLAKKIEQFENKKFFIDDSPNMTMVEIRAKAHKIAQKYGLDMIVIDYLQLMVSGKPVQNRQQEVGEFSRSLKLLAKEMNVPVIAVASLNRGVEQQATGPKKPVLSNLRESGSIEQDADIVMLIHRDPTSEDPRKVNETELIIAKHRNGATANIPLIFMGEKTCFASMSNLEEPSYLAPRKPNATEDAPTAQEPTDAPSDDASEVDDVDDSIDEDFGDF